MCSIRLRENIMPALQINWKKRKERRSYHLELKERGKEVIAHISKHNFVGTTFKSGKLFLTNSIKALV